MRASGTSKKAIGAAYIHNTIQLGIANKQLQAIADWKQQQIILHEAQPNVTTTRSGGEESK